MNKLFYPKLALSNMKKNAKLYVPFGLAVTGAITMFYILCSIHANQGLSEIYGGMQLKGILSLGIFVVGFFSAIFLFYTNQFLMKQRKRELGLYNILGMGKKHIGKILFYETGILYFFCIFCGLVSGIVISKLLFLILLKMLSFSSAVQFAIELGAVYKTISLFGAVFILMLLFNLGQIHLANPISLLQSDQVGEREPKTKWLITLIGILTLGTGYGMALSIESPLEALIWFFVAVILVIIGTYALFIAGSIAVLKGARKNKKYYYQTKHFVGISGMIYRMKQNAAGLANICILSTMVLVMLSTTVCLYSGQADILLQQYPQEVQINDKGYEEGLETGNAEKIVELIQNSDTEIPSKIKNLAAFDYFIFSTRQEGTDFSGTDIKHVNRQLFFLNLDDYNRMEKKNVTLNNDEVLIDSEGGAYEADQFSMLGDTYKVREVDSNFSYQGLDMAGIYKTYYIILPNKETFHSLSEKISKQFSHEGEIESYVAFDFSGKKTERDHFIAELDEILKSADSSAYILTRWSAGLDYMSIFGGLLFIGCFLSVLFLMATVLIIYYKQISEGYEDRNRFQIMQKVGMSKREVRRSIRSQVMTVFFLPLIVAVIHVMFAFPMISKLLLLFNLTNTMLFVSCTVITILIFSMIYGIVYWMTAKEYYRIVN
ncbi:ABC transporter permease [Anaerovorax sp. IOR16]|uniref:ABC transporter permease n=1 Tax=Anaerovorax sp. IOR16 TaxID=2773458 RepID=UPI0019D31DF7|nr:ABC transporter permease [Anaerovorax sp. IOR16]